MDKKNAEVRKELRELGSVKDLHDLIEMALLSEDEQKIIWMHYKEHKPMSFIANDLGMSDATVSRKHARALMKLGKVFI